jgi:hypothetical protein
MTAHALRCGDIVPWLLSITEPTSTTINGGVLQRGQTGTTDAFSISDYIRPQQSPSTVTREVAKQGFYASSAPKISTPLASTQLRFLGRAQLVEQIDIETGSSVGLSGYLVANFLKADGVTPRRVQQTEDGSILIEYGRRGSTCVDVFPNGDVVVIIGRGKVDNVYEFDLTELPKVADLLRDAGFGR